MRIENNNSIIQPQIILKSAIIDSALTIGWGLLFYYSWQPMDRLPSTISPIIKFISPGSFHPSLFNCLYSGSAMAAFFTTLQFPFGPVRLCWKLPTKEFAINSLNNFIGGALIFSTFVIAKYHFNF